MLGIFSKKQASLQLGNLLGFVLLFRSVLRAFRN